MLKEEHKGFEAEKSFYDERPLQGFCSWRSHTLYTYPDKLTQIKNMFFTTVYSAHREHQHTCTRLLEHTETYCATKTGAHSTSASQASIQPPHQVQDDKQSVESIILQTREPHS